MARNYYILLGVSRTESPHGIHEAFRELAKAHHPDRVGPQSTRRFQEILEAYEVLSDPQKRQLHNRELHESELDEAERSAPASAFRPPPEPLIPQSRSILRDFQTIRPGYEPLFDRIFRNFSGLGVPKSEHVEGLHVEVVLSRDEAFTGVTMPIGIPTFYTCPVCEGAGRNWLFPCIECGEQGIIEQEQTQYVRIPPIIRERATLQIPIHGLGIHNLHLCLHIRVAG